MKNKISENETRERLKNTENLVPVFSQDLVKFTMEFMKRNFSHDHYIAESLNVIIGSHFTAMIFMIDFIAQQDSISDESKKEIINLKKKIISIFSEIGELR